MIIILLILLFLFLYLEKFDDDCVEAAQYCTTSDCICCSGIKPACSVDLKGKKSCQCLI